MNRVDDFWRSQSYDLGIDRALGNCVYCFMKGEPALRRLASSEHGDPDAGSAGPASIHWWADIEARYAGPSDDPDVKQFKFLDATVAVLCRDRPTALRPQVAATA